MLRGDSPNLDLLRTVAVSMVFIDHTVGFVTNAPLKSRLAVGWFGGLGVAFFFVHTSLVLMMSLERSQLSGWAMAKSFYLRRAFRIYPLSCLVVLFVFFTGIPQRYLSAHVATGAPCTPMVLLTNLTLTQNLSGQPSLSGQLWSLPVEIDMYVLLPLLFVLTVRHPKAFRWIAWPLAVAIALLVPRIPHLHPLGTLLRFVPFFIPGVLAFSLSKELRPRLTAWLWPLLIAATVLTFMAFLTLEIGWLVCLPLGCLLPLFHEQSNAAVNRITHTLAKYSYGIYLTHLFTIWLAFAYFGSLPLYARVIVFAVFSSLLPYVLYHLVERPGIELGKRVAARATDSPAQPHQVMPRDWRSGEATLCENSGIRH